MHHHGDQFPFLMLYIRWAVISGTAFIVLILLITMTPFGRIFGRSPNRPRL